MCAGSSKDCEEPSELNKQASNNSKVSIVYKVSAGWDINILRIIMAINSTVSIEILFIRTIYNYNNKFIKNRLTVHMMFMYG